MDTFEQRLIADLTDAAEAAVDRGLTPPDRAAVAASVARRQRRHRVQVLAAVAAVVVALAGLAAVLTGGAGLDRTEMGPPATQPTAPPATSRPAPTPTTPDDSTPTTPDTATTDVTTEPGSSPATTPNDPEQPGNVPDPLPVTADEMQAIGANYDALPPVCRNFWDTVGRTPEDFGLNRTQNLLEVEPESIKFADLDGDGVDDGIATFRCVTTGVLPPSGLTVTLSAEGHPVLFDDGTLSDDHEAQYGDGRAVFQAQPLNFAFDEDQTLDWDIFWVLDSYRSSDPDCCPSERVAVYYRIEGDRLVPHGFSDTIYPD